MGKADPGHLIEAVLKCKVAEPAYKGQSDYVSIIASASTPPALPPAGQLLVVPCMVQLTFHAHCTVIQRVSAYDLPWPNYINVSVSC